MKTKRLLIVLLTILALISVFALTACETEPTDEGNYWYYDNNNNIVEW